MDHVRVNLVYGLWDYYIRNENEDVVYAMAKGLGETTNIKVMAIREVINFSNSQNYRGIIIE